MYINPWEPNNDAQKQLFAKLNHEQAVCNACEKNSKCFPIDRMNSDICQNLRERMEGV